MATLGLFEGVGIELEYMIVNTDNLDILPMADESIRDLAESQGYVNDVQVGDIGISNEFVNHVMEFKTPFPVSDLNGLDQAFVNCIRVANGSLAGFRGILLPGAMHPWMDPATEMHIWKHDNQEIYDTYHRIFNARGHGWSNLQSMHINLPFANDEEFGMLHAAIRLVLPLLPALAASSPVADGESKNVLDYRLQVYFNNQKEVPEVAGLVVPEAVFTEAEYRKDILQVMYDAIAPRDRFRILQDEWLNSRGAIARFDRNAIEIRVLDVQECPAMDIAIAALVIHTLKDLVNEVNIPYDAQKDFDTKVLSTQLKAATVTGMDTTIMVPDLAQAFGYWEEDDLNLGALWSHLIDRALEAEENLIYQDRWNIFRHHGNLSTRLLKALKGDFSRKNLEEIYGGLPINLAHNKPFLP